MAQMSLKAARVNAELSQQELAEKMGVSRETVFAWENGKRAMRPVWINLFCTVVGVEQDDIFLPKVTT